MHQSLRFSSVVCLLGFWACAPVDDVNDVPAVGGDGTENAGATASGGKSNGGGASASGGTANTGGASNVAGSSTGGASSVAGSSTGGAAAGGNGGDGGDRTPDAGAGNGVNGGASEGGAGGAAEPVSNTVHGTVIDFWGHGLGNISVQIGDQIVATDQDGKFTAADVPAEYDASLKIAREEGNKVYGWVYQGLTRRDPTLQVYQGRDDHYTSGYVFVSGATLGASDTISASLGTPDGASEKTDLSTDANGNYFAPEWQGAETTQGTIHALQWSVNQATSLPSAYKSYYSALIALSETVSLADTTLTMAGPIVDGSVTGTVTPVADGDRNNGVFVRFNSGASIRLVDQDAPTANAFSYVVPQLANASISVVASEGASYSAFGLVHKDGLHPGDEAGTLKIPTPATTLSPNGGNANLTTPFSFSGSADSKGAFVIHIEATQFYQSVYIVTTKKSFTLPTPIGHTWIGGRGYSWRVETFGSLATVDQMAGPAGFADAYYGPTQSTSTGEPQGPSHESGSFTISEPGYFTYN
jgi:hypothetical protein